MDRTAWVALSLTERVGRKTLHALLAHFDGDLSAVLQADEEHLRRVRGVGPKIAQSIRAIDSAQVEVWMHDWQQEGITIITSYDPIYPHPLRDLPDAPPTLFLRGCAASYERAAAVVGTRTPSEKAQALAFHIGVRLAEMRYTVVSGLAYGVDTFAHRGALSVTHGCTTAVLGSGVSNVYPPENRPLAECCTLMSEVAPFAPLSSARLVARNRIISGLSAAVIVVETEVEGGAMHAARRAREQNRRIYTIDLPASGNQQLIREGAAVIDAQLHNLEKLLCQTCS